MNAVLAAADSTVGTIHGRRMMARSSDLNGRFSFSSSASHRPSANFSTVATPV